MVALFVIATIIVFLLADAVVLWARRHRAAQTVEAPGLSLSELLPEPSVPGGVFLSPAHLWVSLMPSGQARVGLDPLVRAAMGEPDTIDAPVSGTRVRKGQALFSARWGGRSVMFPSPVEGTVQAACPTDGGLDNDAWVLTLQPEHAKSDLDTLPLAEEAVRWFAGEWERLRAFVAGGGLQAVPAMAMPDGGKPAPGWMKLEPDETWDRFVDTFLRPEEPHAH